MDGALTKFLLQLSEAKSASRDIQSQLGSLTARVEKNSESAYNDIKSQASAAADKASTKAKGWFK